MSENKKYTLLKVLKEVGNLVPQLFKQWKVFSCYAGLLTLLGMFFGQWPHSCFKNNFWCVPLNKSNEYFQTIFISVYIILCIFITLFFMYDFYKSAFKNTVFKVRDIYIIGKEKIKSAGFILLTVLICAIPLRIALIILFKPADPNWQVEFIYFIIAFICIMVPIMAIRLFCFVSAYYEKNTIPSLLPIFQKTIGKSYVGIFLFLLLAWIIILTFRISYNLDVLSRDYNYLPIALLTSFAEYFLRLEYLAVFLLFSRAQYICMNLSYSTENGEKDE